MRSALARMPIRIRLTLVYAAGVALVLAAVAGVLYLRFESELNRTIDADLRSRAQALAALVAQQGPSVAGGATGEELLRPQEAVAQVLAVPSARVLIATPSVAGLRLLDPREATAAASGALLITRTDLPGVAKRARFAAAPVPGRRDEVVVVGRSLKDREGANESFAKALLIGGPLALLLSAVAGYGLAAAALRPVERMRRRAESISAAEPGLRLPVPPADDELGRLGRTLNRMLARLEDALAQQRALTANASHELRTPLAVLCSTLEVALRRARSPAETEAVMREALTEARRLAHLADELLVLARLDEQRAPAAVEVADAAAVVDTVVERLREPAAREGRRIVYDGDQALVRADPRALEQAVENLVANALVHGQGTIMVNVTHDDARVRIRVCDEGAGMDAAFAPHAFERFARGADTQGRPGSGLGLAIVQAVVERYGGEAGIGPGPGSEVWIALPAAPAG